MKDEREQDLFENTEGKTDPKNEKKEPAQEQFEDMSQSREDRANEAEDKAYEDFKKQKQAEEKLNTEQTQKNEKFQEEQNPENWTRDVKDQFMKDVDEIEHFQDSGNHRRREITTDVPLENGTYASYTIASATDRDRALGNTLDKDGKVVLHSNGDMNIGDGAVGVVHGDVTYNNYAQQQPKKDSLFKKFLDKRGLFKIEQSRLEHRGQDVAQQTLG